LPDRGAYLDILRYEDFTAKAQSPTTPAVSLLFALDRQMEDIGRETLAGRYARHAAMAFACTAWVERVAGLGISVFANSSHRSPSVTCIRTAGKPSDVLTRMRAEGFELGGGQAGYAASTFRIGHMGDHTVGGVTAMLDVLERVLRAR
jgi:aspartate aminotransferase-like enzyme